MRITDSKKRNDIELNIIAIVAIVGIVAIVLGFFANNKRGVSSDLFAEENLVGQAFSKQKCDAFLEIRGIDFLDSKLFEKQCSQYYTCSDSDGGKEYYVKGTVSGYDKPTGRYGSVSDNCEGDYVLNEYVCDGIYGMETEYQCPNGCRDGACISGYDFELKEIAYDKIPSFLTSKINYTGNVEEKFVDKAYWVILQNPEVSFFSVSQSIFRQGHDFFYGNFILSDNELNNIMSKYPEGNFPYNLTLLIAPTVGSFDRFEAETVFKHEGVVKIIPLSDNYEFKIGVVQVVPPGFDFEKQNICLIRHKSLENGSGFKPSGISENCEEKFPYAFTRSYKLTDVIFSDEPYTSIDNVTSTENYREDKADTIDVFSFKYIGTFWENLLRKHDIVDVDTKLKKNPKFTVTLLDPVEKEDTLNSSEDYGAIIAFFKDAVEENNINLSPYDFIEYIQYQPEMPDGNFFSRSFAPYISCTLYANAIVFNDCFETIVHEIGHQLFALKDLYYGLGSIQYPEGVPDPFNFPNRKACIMANFFGFEKVSDDRVRTYETEDYDDEEEALGLDRFQTENPENFVLCVKTIVEIMRGVENPNCSVDDFYAGNCGSCTSENYLSCVSQ